MEAHHAQVEHSVDEVGTAWQSQGGSRTSEGIVISIHGKGGREGAGLSLSCEALRRTEIVKWCALVLTIAKQLSTTGASTH